MSGKRMAQPAKGKSSLWDSQHYFRRASAHPAGQPSLRHCSSFGGSQQRRSSPKK